MIQAFPNKYHYYDKEEKDKHPPTDIPYQILQQKHYITQHYIAAMLLIPDTTYPLIHSLHIGGVAEHVIQFTILHISQRSPLQPSLQSQA